MQDVLGGKKLPKYRVGGHLLLLGLRCLGPWLTVSLLPSHSHIPVASLMLH